MEKRIVCKCEDEINPSQRHAFRREGEGGFSGNAKWSHKDYEMVAEVIRRTASDVKYDSRISPEGLLNRVIDRFIQVFESDNNRFDESRFRKAASI